MNATTRPETAPPAVIPEAGQGDGSLGLRSAGDGVCERVRRRAAGGTTALDRRELLGVCSLAVLLAVVSSWPLVLHMGSRIAPDLGDPIRTAWQIAWVGHALVHQPLHLWSANVFWPAQHSLAFSDSLLGYAPAGLIGSGPVAAIARYNLLLLFAYALAFVGPYLLARELGLGRGGAAVAGAAFAYAPFRGAEAGHLHVISSGGIALALFLLVRGYRRLSPATVAAGWAVAAWQLSLGFTLGLQLAYLLAALAVIAAVYWLRRGRPRLPSALVGASAAGIGLFVLVAVYQAHPYVQVSHDYPSARRTIAEVQRYSAPARALLAAPVNNRVWGGATASLRDTLSSRNESDLFPGATIALLALVGVAVPSLRRRLRLALLAAAAVTALLALGLSLTSGGYPYRLLYDHLPGWDAVRTPGRLITVTSLALALLAGAGAHWLLRRRAILARTGAPLALGGLLIAIVVFEGAGRLPDPVVPPLPRGQQLHLRGPVLDLPTDPANDRLYQLWSTADWQSIANGNSTFDIPAQDDLRGGMQNFPDPQGVAKLQRLGIRTVVLYTRQAALPPLHYAIPEPPNPLQAATKSIAGLPLTRRQVGSVVIFDVKPGG